MSYKVNAIVLAALGACALQINTVSAATLSYELIGTGTRTGSGTVTSYSSTTPSTDHYGNNVPSSALIPSTSYSFYDDYLISIPTGQFDNLTSSISQGNLSVNNLQVRLYNAANNSPLPVTGTPNGGAIDGWSASVPIMPGSTASFSVIPTTQLNQGTYVLEVRGVAGSGGGSYSGNLNLTPVPLPAALPLLLSGMGVFGAAARRRKDARPA